MLSQGLQISAVKQSSPASEMTVHTLICSATWVAPKSNENESNY